MSHPTFHSYTWSDIDDNGAAQPAAHEPTPNDPLGLIDKELRVWVTYPERRKKKAKRKRREGKSRHRRRSLWAVVIVERLNKQDDFTYEVTLKRIFKTGERLIEIWVKNDPADQSEDAAVFGVISPCAERLDSFEQQLSMWAAKRVYDAIAGTWPGERPEVSLETVPSVPRQRNPK